MEGVDIARAQLNRLGVKRSVEKCQNGGVISTPLLIKLLSLRPLDSNQNGGCVKSGRSDALKPDRLGLSYKANKCSDIGAGDLGVLPNPESSLCNRLHNKTASASISDADSTRPG